MTTEDLFYKKGECVYIITHEHSGYFMFTAHGKSGRYKIAENRSEKMASCRVRTTIANLSSRGFVKTYGYIDDIGRFFIETGAEAQTKPEKKTDIVFDLSKLKNQDSILF